MNNNFHHKLTAGELKASLLGVSDDAQVMIQRLDDASLKAGFELRHLVFEEIDRHDVDQNVLEEIGNGTEKLTEDYLYAASVNVNCSEHLVLINFNQKL